MHQPPLLLLLFRPLYELRHVPSAWLARWLVCCCLDLLVAAALRLATREAVHVEERGLVWEEHALRLQHRVPLARVPRESTRRASQIPDAVAALYLLHPYTLLTSCAMSTAVLSYACVAVALSFAVRGACSPCDMTSGHGISRAGCGLVSQGACRRCFGWRLPATSRLSTGWWLLA